MTEFFETSIGTRARHPMSKREARQE